MQKYLIFESIHRRFIISCKQLNMNKIDIKLNLNNTREKIFEKRNKIHIK